MHVIRRAIEAMEDSPIIEVWRMGFSTPDVIGLWAGEPDLPTPQFICEPAMTALFAGETFYSQNRGIPPLRAALAGYLRRLYRVEVTDERIAMTSSGMNAVTLVAQAVIEPGDAAVVVTPSWPNIVRALAVVGARVDEVALIAGPAGWRLDLDRLFAACRARTKLIYFASPANPTGWMLEPPQAQDLLDFARQNGIAILADEVYHRLVYDRPVAVSMLEIARQDDPVFIVNSFSKSWAMTGWRMGWLIYPAGCSDAFEKLIQFSTSGGQAFLQHGAIAALRDGEPFVRHFVARCRAGRDIVNARLAAMPRARVVPNRASFYSMFEVEGMADTLQFCKRAVTRAKVGMAPGIAFGKGAERLVRICYAKSPELLHAAMDRLAPFVADYREA
ncbi:MAG: pyridoxal phosphate-dependent aminotransferase [Methylobacteriaceae bacterium]|nr:pyridoxal phosphate-dependent aminotransferase [Methylobacteriaceae bacterium]